MLEPNFHLGRGKVRWERVLFFFGLTAALAILSSCGKSSSTTVTPTITVSCTPSSVILLGTSQCTANVLSLSSTLVNWTVSGTVTGANVGSITTGGLYTAPAAIPGTNGTANGTANVVTVTATSQVQSTLTATQNLTLVLPTAISAVTCLDPNNVVTSTVSSGNRMKCSATASTGAIVPVNWSVTNKNNPTVTTNLGSISSQGIYTAALVPPPGQSITITATSQALATETMSVTATVVFGNAVLKGAYVFSTSGRLPTKAFWARVGSFSAGGGVISGISEDTNQGGTPNTVRTQRSFTGSYSIGPDGRGTMQFCEDTSSSCPQGSPATAYFRVVVISPQQAQIIEYSSPTTSSATTIAGGEMIAQDPLVSPNEANLSGTYSFDFAGVSTSATEEFVVGEFLSNGHSTISAGSSVAPLAPGEMDIDAGGPLALAATTYSISSNGRGTVTLNAGSASLTFSFYPVSTNRAKFLEIDTASLATPTVPASILIGDSYLQQTSSNCGWALNALSGSTVLETSGTSSGVVITDLGSFTATNGAVNAVSMDQNSGGVYTQPTGSGTDNYTMDACGRGTLSIGSHSYVFYIISASDAVLQETTSGVTAHGFLVPVPAQTGAFADSTLTGSYAFRLGGTDAAGTAGNREDFLGQLTSAGTGKGLAGTLDLNDFGATQTPVAIANGTYLPAGGLRATMALPLNTAPSPTTRNFVLYMVNPKLFYVLDADPPPAITAGTAIGVMINQF